MNREEWILYRRWTKLSAGYERAELAARIARLPTEAELSAQFVTETVAFLTTFFLSRGY